MGISLQTDQLLWLLFFLQIKHLAADFVLQPREWQKNKGDYPSSGGAKHALLHAVLTGAVLFAFSVSFSLVAIIFVLEAIVHFHIDWVKAKLVREWELAFTHSKYWWLFGLDQCLHQLTYLGIVLLLVS